MEIILFHARISKLNAHAIVAVYTKIIMFSPTMAVTARMATALR